MCYEEISIELSDEVNAIISKNLNQKSETVTVNIKSCEECRYYDDFWFLGGTLHCCGQDYNIPVVSREIDDLYDNCLINYEYESVRTYIKRYGIIHHKPSRYECGCISVVDFKDTHFESDGYNPSIEWEALVNFFYHDEEEADKMMELAVKYYDEFDLDDEYCKKNCYG